MYYLGFGESPGLEVPLRCLVLSQVARAAQQPQFDEEISFKLHSEQQLELWWYGKKRMLGKVCCSGTVQWDQQIMPDISDPQGGCLNQCKFGHWQALCVVVSTTGKQKNQSERYPCKTTIFHTTAADLHPDD